MTPVAGVTLAVAVPSLPPGQDIKVVVALKLAGVSPTTAVAVALQPLPSI